MGKWTEVDVYTGLPKKMDEDAPTNNAGSGAVAMPPDAMMKKKKKKSLIDARSKSYKEHRKKLELAREKRKNIKSKIIEKIKDDVMQFNRESLLAEDNMETLRNIVKTKSAKPLKFKDGSMKVDLFTASAITKVYDKVKSKEGSRRRNKQ